MTSGLKIAAIAAALSTVLDKFSIAVFLPALPFLTDSLQVSREDGQLSVSAYFAGVALSQLVWGYVSDVRGRRRVLLTLLPIYLAGCLMTALSGGFFMASAGLFVQGFGIGGVFSVTQALIGHGFGRERAAKALAAIAMMVSWSSALGAVIGGWLVHHMDWHASFLFLGLCAALMVPLYLALPADRPTDAGKISPVKVARDYLGLATERVFMKYVLTVALLNAGLFVFYTVSPFLIIHDLGLSPRQYGLFMLIPFTGFMLGRFLCTRLLGRISGDGLIRIGGLTALIGGGAMVAGSATMGQSAWVIMLSMALYLVGMGLAAPNARANAMHSHAALIGAAASFLSVVVNALGAGNGFIAAHMPDRFMAWYILAAGLMTLTLFALLDRRSRR